MKLYLVPTPIGNLEDMTFRAIRILKEVDFVLAEDTRTSGVLMKHYNITTPMHAYHLHNEHKSIDRFVDRIKGGETAAIVTDAGTPGISDPGFLMARACVENDIEIDTLPGATAFVPALVNSGFPCDRFYFEGFLPQKKGRQTRFAIIANQDKTTILYESPHRIIKTLTQLQEHIGDDRKISISREISKKFEETVRGTIPTLLNHFNNKAPKAEFVMVIEGAK